MQILQIEVYKTKRGKTKKQGFRFSAYFEYLDGSTKALRDISEAFAQMLTEAMLHSVASTVGHVHRQVNGFIWVLPGGQSLFDLRLH